VHTENWDNVVHTMSRLQDAQSVVQSRQEQEIFLFSTMSRLTLQTTLPLFSGYQGTKLTTHLHLLLAKDLKQVELYSPPSIYLHAIDRGSFSHFYACYNKTGTSKHKVVSLLHSMRHTKTRMTGSSERDFFFIQLHPRANMNYTFLSHYWHR